MDIMIPSNKILASTPLRKSSRSPLVMYAVLLLSALLCGTNAAEQCPMIGDGEFCPGGCWLSATEELQLPVGNNGRQCTSVGFGYFSPDNSNQRRKCPMGTFSDTENARVCEDCEAGSFASGEGQMECQLCPAGSFSDSTKSTICIPCNDQFYNGEGTNSAEMWNGEYYCIDPTPPTFSPSMAPTQATTTSLYAPSSVPTQFASSAPTMSASSGATGASTDQAGGDDNNSDDEDTVVSQEDYVSTLDKSFSCDSEENMFQWHRQCRQCPSKTEQGLLTFVTFLFLAAIIIVLEKIVPLCSTGTVWVGIEYLQLLYFISYLDISWPPIASFVIEKIVPIFSLDFSANISGQCLFGWSKEWDQMLMIFWPVLLLTLVYIKAKSSKHQSVQNIVCHRWPMVSLKIGLVAFFQSSKDALDFSSIWGTTVSGIPTTSYYAGVAGIAGLCFYFAYVVFFCYGLFCYKKTHIMGKENINKEPCEDQEDIESLSSDIQTGRESYNSSHHFWFLSMGLFPAVQETVWGWPMAWILRSLLFFGVYHFIPRSTETLLGSLFGIVIVFYLLHSFFEPFPNQCEKNLGSKWFHAKTTDIFLHLFFFAMAGVSWLALNLEESSSSGATAVDVLTIIVVSASMIYWVSAIAFASKLSCKDCVPFGTIAQQIYVEMEPAAADGDDQATDAPQSAGQMDDMVEIPLSGRTPPIPFIPPNPSNLSNASSSCSSEQRREIVFGGNEESPIQNKWKATKASAIAQEIGRRNANNNNNNNNNKPNIFRRGNSIISNLDEDDMETVLEEVWVDAEGREVDQNGNWVDSETGRRITKR
jgi:hypothetical protein